MAACWRLVLAVILVGLGSCLEDSQEGSTYTAHSAEQTSSSFLNSNSNGSSTGGTATVENTGGLGNDSPMTMTPESVKNACSLSPCICDDRLKQAWCSGLDLDNIPETLPQDTRHLFFRGNRLTRVDDDTFRDFPELISLHLEYNFLPNVSPKAFRRNGQLQLLDLRGNQLGKNSNLMFLCDSTPSLTSVDLSENGIQEDNLYLLTLCNMSNILSLDLSRNNISNLPSGFLQNFPGLNTLQLESNSLTHLPLGSSDSVHPLQWLSLAHNKIMSVNCSSLESLPQLRALDLSFNLLGGLPLGICQHFLQKLMHLNFSGNTVSSVSSETLLDLKNLKTLRMAHMKNMSILVGHFFRGLPQLETLDLSYNSHLQFIHAQAFSGLESLKHLDLSHSDLSWIHQDILENLTSLESIRLEGNPWHCNCDLKWLPGWLFQLNQNRIPQKIECSSPPYLSGHNLLNETIVVAMECQGPIILTWNITQWLDIGEEAMIDCEVDSESKSKVTWITPLKDVLEYHPAYHDLSGPDPIDNLYHLNHNRQENKSYYSTLPYEETHMIVLPNGSLYIDYVTRKDAGSYICKVDNGYGNSTAAIMVRLDSSILKWFIYYSMFWGMVSACAFFFVTMVISGIQILTFKCSLKERNTRKGIREVLNDLQDFKTMQIDRLCAYKTAKLNKLSAYKNAKIHKLVAFKTAKIDKLRNYKQVTVASIFHHLDRLRDHYNGQMIKVRDNCTQQIEKLRENYGNHICKFKDYRLEKIDSVKDNYNGQVQKIRDYRTSQLNKLRDQYKLQQQHLLKLMELLDIGNCLNVVEAECMRTESMLFDPNISFDLEAQPVHVSRDFDYSDESEYVTAGSLSDLSDKEGTTPANTKSSRGDGDKASKYDRAHSGDQAEPRRVRRKRRKHNLKPAGPRGSMSSSSDEYIPARCDSNQDDPDSSLPPPPNFSCSIPELNNMSLEQLAMGHFQRAYYSEQDLDSASMYQTPPTSAHQDIEAPSVSGRPHTPGRVSLAESASTTEYESVVESREQTPVNSNPTHKNQAAPDEDSKKADDSSPRKVLRSKSSRAKNETVI